VCSGLIVTFSIWTLNLWNKRYRFRLISMACSPNYVFSIDGHSFTVIEADGVSHQPLVVDSLRIFAGTLMFFLVSGRHLPHLSSLSLPGQRYSIVVRIRDL